MALNKKNGFLLLNAVLAAAVVILDLFYMAFGGLWLKATTSSGFALLGVCNLCYALLVKERRLFYPIFMAVGLLLCLAADVILNISFIPGALVFALGHVAYFVAYCGLLKIKPIDFIPFAVICIASVLIVTLVPSFDFGSPLMEGVILLYAFVISLMVGKALSNAYRAPALPTVLMAVGSVLFYFSDFMLLLRYFADGPQLTDDLCLLSYYPAQCFLAVAVYFYVVRGTGKEKH